MRKLFLTLFIIIFLWVLLQLIGLMASERNNKAVIPYYDDTQSEASKIRMMLVINYTKVKCV
jgi:hypothetical protein